MSDVHPLSSLTYEDWTEFRWTEITTGGDAERMFVKGLALTPPEQGEMVARLKGVNVAHRPRVYDIGAGAKITLTGSPDHDGAVVSMAINSRAYRQKKPLADPAISKPERLKRTGLARWLLGE